MTNISNSQTIQVFLRVRPYLPSICQTCQQDQETSCQCLTNKLQLLPEQNKIIITRNKGKNEFSFDKIFDSKITQSQLYSACNVIPYILDGINCCIMTYGQTNTGKTYTMYGKGWEDAQTIKNSLKSLKLDESIDLEISQNDDINSPLSSPTKINKINSPVDSPVASTSPTSPTHSSQINNNYASLSDEDLGIVPRCLVELFDALKKKEKESVGFQYSVSCQMVQIYNEKIYDLMQDKKKKNPLTLREQDGKVVIVGVSSYEVQDVNETLKLVRKSVLNKAVRSTEFNAQSSRSHSVLLFHVRTIEKKLKKKETENNGETSTPPSTSNNSTSPSTDDGNNDEEVKIVKNSTLTLVDLAGSEKWRQSLNASSNNLPPKSTSQTSNPLNQSTNSLASTLNSQQSGIVNGSSQQLSSTYSPNPHHQLTEIDSQVKEMTTINTSLHVLGNCIAAIVEQERKHIPFRDSLLTRLLQNTLSGQGKTILIATLHSNNEYIDENFSTLNFASRTSRIKVNLTPNVDVESQVRMLKNQLAKYKNELNFYKNQISNNSRNCTNCSNFLNEISILEEENNNYKDIIDDLKKKLYYKEKEINEKDQEIIEKDKLIEFLKSNSMNPKDLERFNREAEDDDDDDEEKQEFEENEIDDEDDEDEEEVKKIGNNLDELDPISQKTNKRDEVEEGEDEDEDEDEEDEEHEETMKEQEADDDDDDDDDDETDEQEIENKIQMNINQAVNDTINNDKPINIDTLNDLNDLKNKVQEIIKNSPQKVVDASINNSSIPSNYQLKFDQPSQINSSYNNQQFQQQQYQQQQYQQQQYQYQQQQLQQQFQPPQQQMNYNQQNQQQMFNNYQFAQQSQPPHQQYSGNYNNNYNSFNNYNSNFNPSNNNYNPNSNPITNTNSSQCAKHGLEDCVLCNILSSSTSNPLSFQSLNPIPQQYGLQFNSIPVQPIAPTQNSSISIKDYPLTSSLSSSVSTCKAHGLLNCLLCGMNSSNNPISSTPQLASSLFNNNPSNSLSSSKNNLNSSISSQKTISNNISPIMSSPIQISTDAIPNNTLVSTLESLDKNEKFSFSSTQNFNSNTTTPKLNSSSRINEIKSLRHSQSNISNVLSSLENSPYRSSLSASSALSSPNLSHKKEQQQQQQLPTVQQNKKEKEIPVNNEKIQLKQVSSVPLISTVNNMNSTVPIKEITKKKKKVTKQNDKIDNNQNELMSPPKRTKSPLSSPIRSIPSNILPSNPINNTSKYEFLNEINSNNHHQSHFQFTNPSQPTLIKPKETKVVYEDEKDYYDGSIPDYYSSLNGGDLTFSKYFNTNEFIKRHNDEEVEYKNHDEDDDEDDDDEQDKIIKNKKITNDDTTIKKKKKIIKKKKKIIKKKL